MQIQTPEVYTPRTPPQRINDSLSIHICRPKKKVHFSYHLNRKPNSYFNSQNTGPLSVSRAVIKITLIGVVADSTEQQGRICRRSTTHCWRACQLTHGWGKPGSRTLKLPSSLMVSKDREQQGSCSSTPFKHCSLSLRLCTSPPFPS